MVKLKLDLNTFTQKELETILLEAGRRQMADPTNNLVSRQQIFDIADDAGYDSTPLHEAIGVVLEQRQVTERRNSLIHRGIGILAGVAVVVGAYFGVAYSRRMYENNNQIEARVLGEKEEQSSFQCQMYGDHYSINAIDRTGTTYSLHFRNDSSPFDDDQFCDGMEDLARKIDEGSQIQFPHSAVESNNHVYLGYNDVKIVKP